MATSNVFKWANNWYAIFKKIIIIGGFQKFFNIIPLYFSAYLILYTTDDTSSDSDWVSEVIEGDLMSFVIKGLTPNTNYFFKIQAKNSVGYGPFSSTISCKTSLGIFLILILYYSPNEFLMYIILWKCKMTPNWSLDLFSCKLITELIINSFEMLVCNHNLQSVYFIV